jgi:hypothetical protein
VSLSFSLFSSLCVAYLQLRKNKNLKKKKSRAASGGVAGSLDLERRVEMGYDTLAQLLTQHWNNDGGKHTRNTHTILLLLFLKLLFHFLFPLKQTRKR